MASSAEASKDGCLDINVTLPDGSLREKWECWLVDRDGADVLISDVKKSIFKEFAPDLNPQNYNLVLVKDGNRVFTQDDRPTTDYHTQLFLKFTATFEKK